MKSIVVSNDALSVMASSKRTATKKLFIHCASSVNTFFPRASTGLSPDSFASLVLYLHTIMSPVKLDYQVFCLEKT